MLSPGKGGAAPVYGHALGHATYERHRPEQTLLYQLVEKHYPALVEQLAFQGKSLPTHVNTPALIAKFSLARNEPPRPALPDRILCNGMTVRS